MRLSHLARARLPVLDSFSREVTAALVTWRVRLGRLEQRLLADLQRWLRGVGLGARIRGCWACSGLLLLLPDQRKGLVELGSQNLAKVDEAVQDLELGGPRHAALTTAIVSVELVQIVDKRVFLAQGHGAVEQTVADDLHHPLDLQRLEGHLLLAKDPENASVAHLDGCIWPALALHASGVDDLVTVPSAEDVDQCWSA
jgi:hypothetical protein